MNGRPRHPGRRQLLGLAALFFVPLVAAVLLYRCTDWRPAPAAHGLLVEPPRPLPRAPLHLPDGRSAPADVLTGHWFLVHPIDGPCDADCLAVLDELARVRLALDKDAGRVRRVLLHAGRCCTPGAPPEASDLLVLAAPGDAGAALFALFPAVAGGDGIYMVDPHGNLILGYPAQNSARGLLRDLERLLRLSKIG